MKLNLESIFNIDRRIIFVFIFLAVLVPFLVEFELPIKANKNVKKVYDKIEEVAEKKGTMLLSFDFDMASKAELEPMAKAIISHIFKRDIKLVAMGHWPNGVRLAKSILKEMADEYGKKYGTDWAYMGYKPGFQILIINLGKNFNSAFPTDSRGNNTKKLRVTSKIRTIKDFDYVISLSAGSGGIEEWVIYGQSKFNFYLGGGCTAVMAPDFFPFLQSGQLNGLIGGLAGAAQYEALVEKPDKAIVGMKPQSVTHVILIFFIIFGNICYFVEKYRKKKMNNME